MGVFSAMNVSATGMTAQQMRMDVIAQNIANANTTRTENGGAYRRKTVVFEEQDTTSFDHMLNGYMSNYEPNGVKVTKIVEDPSDLRLVYEPDNPDANADGYVEYPNVDTVTEMTNLIDSSRSYEAGKNIDGNTGDKSSSASPTDAEHLSDNDLQAEVERRGEQQSEEMYEEVMQMAETYAIDDQIILDFNDQYVELDLNGSILFDSGNAEIKDNSKLFLQKIAQILVKYKYNVIEIEGHTDNIPISNSKYEDNRSLSSERARSVYEYVVSQEHFIDSNIKIAGYGDSRPVASNETEEGRAKNRRVAIKIYNKQNSNN